MKHYLENIKHIRNEIEVLSSAKKEIQDKILILESQEKSIREEILNSMLSSNRRYESIDGLAEIKVQKTARAYETIDEEELINFLKSMGRYDDIVKTTTKISNAPLTKFLDELRSSDSLPKCIKIKEAEDSLRITFENGKKNADHSGDVHINSTKKDYGSLSSEDVESFDGV